MAAGTPTLVETTIPARLDRLAWNRFHTLVIVALGITWILDGLEVTLAGAISGALKESPTLRFTNTDIGYAGTAYLLGAVLGALGFGWLTDRWGRKKLFFITLAVYLTATFLTAFSWNLWSFCLFRFLTGAGIGGEYTAINSTIQEFVPAKYRGRVDLIVNGSFWIGAALGAGGSVVLLNPAILDPEHGWRLCFVIGAGLGLGILVLRRWVPESPRWLVTHGRAPEGERIAKQIETHAGARDPTPAAVTRLHARTHTPLAEVFHVLFRLHRQRALVGLALMGAQAFFYNAVFFTYALVLTDFYGVETGRVGLYILPFAAGNFLGPVLLGRFFDTVGRRPMIAGTYILSGLLLAGSGWLFQQEMLSATGQTLAWMVVFFVASAAASSAYLTVGETFPLEIRALAIAVFYAIGTGIGGAAGPILFGALVDTGSRTSVFAGYLFGSALMVGAGIVQWIWGVASERRSLEDVARPLSAAPALPPV
ncbi:MFS transporter [Enterovirga sp.]|uniref:MFS transporter n=1 Tax=Enterovirga sp. TaxID=2026350 RepID=UPI00262AF1F4|nr:MFS transporter [Enterovirga sp.]MDB5589905.1 major facilitator superfamily [Enterovirga sp.]